MSETSATLSVPSGRSFYSSLVLLAATMTMGISTGVFQLYAFAIMPGLRRTDDSTFVTAFQQIDIAIVGPWLFVFFFGSLGFTALAAAFHFGAGDRTTLYWIVAALVLYLVVFVITITINVPLNDEIKAAGEAGEIADFAAARERFHEATWVGGNFFRAVSSTVAFGCLAWALVSRGRS